MSVTFRENANDEISKKLYMKTTKAMFKSLVEAVNNDYEASFCTSFQNYVTRLGQILNESSDEDPLYSKTFSAAKDFLCTKVIYDEQIKATFESINADANDVKHSTYNVSVNIQRNILAYNRLISKIIGEYGLNSLKVCQIKTKKLENIAPSYFYCAICSRAKPIAETLKCRNCGKIICESCFSLEQNICVECVTKNVEQQLKIHEKETKEQAKLESLKAEYKKRLNFLNAMGIKFVGIPNRKYFMSTIPVTNKLYFSVMQSYSYYSSSPDLPVYIDSYRNAIIFCNRLSKIMGLPSCYFLDGTANVDIWGKKIDDEESYRITYKASGGIRLPTESEWIYCAVSGCGFTFSGSDDIDEVGWFRGNTDRLQVSGLKKPNKFGLYDMSGNISELVSDRPPDSDSSGVHCYTFGGSFTSSADECKLDSCMKKDDYGYKGIRLCIDNSFNLEEINEDYAEILEANWKNFYALAL